MLIWAGPPFGGPALRARQYIWEYFFREGVPRSFFEATSVHVIKVQNVILMINFDVWDRLGHVRTILDTVRL